MEEWIEQILTNDPALLRAVRRGPGSRRLNLIPRIGWSVKAPVLLCMNMRLVHEHAAASCFAGQRRARKPVTGGQVSEQFHHKRVDSSFVIAGHRRRFFQSLAERPKSIGIPR